MKKISLDRIRPERSRIRVLTESDLATLDFSLAKEKKKILKQQAKQKGYSISLYINLILTKQEPSPFA